MKLFELASTPGTKKEPFRKGRGHGSGNGKTAGKGHKGQNARAGGGVRPGFEGGQMPLYRKVPKRGFNNKRFAKVFAEISLSDLNVFENGSTVAIPELIEKGIVRNHKYSIVVLGNGELTKELIVRAAKFTKSASQKIEAVGGKAEVV